MRSRFFVFSSLLFLPGDSLWKPVYWTMWLFEPADVFHCRACSWMAEFDIGERKPGLVQDCCFETLISLLLLSFPHCLNSLLILPEAQLAFWWLAISEPDARVKLGSYSSSCAGPKVIATSRRYANFEVKERRPEGERSTDIVLALALSLS